MLLRSVFRLILIIAAIVLVASACSSAGDTAVIAPAAPNSEVYRLDQTVYNTQCASCHGVNGEGQFPDAPLERDVTGRYGAPPHDDTGHTWHHDDDLLLRIVREGGMGDPVNFYVMPAFETVLSKEEMEAVIAYIKTMWTPEQQAAQHERTLAVRAEQP
jgi:mono/diheme cytochrome c family protein